MILLWSRWFQVTIVTKTFILNFSFPEARFVPSFTKSSSNIGVPWVPWAACACSCVPMCGGMCGACVHDCVSVVLPSPVLCSCRLQNSLFRKVAWKGDEAFGLWCGFYSHILPLIRQTSPPNPLLSLWGLKGLWEARFENLAVVVLGLCLWTQGGLNVMRGCEIRCPQVWLWHNHTIPKMILLNPSFLTSCFDALWRQSE